MNEKLVTVCFYGPESTGKTTMAERMAACFHTVFVPEVGRETIQDNTTFTGADIVRTAQLQVERITEQQKAANRILFCDSDHFTTAIYSQHYLGYVPPQVYQLGKKISYDCYFLFDIDVPWISDGVRDLGTPAQRTKMYTLFREELTSRAIPFIEVHGTWHQREWIVLDTLLKMFGLSPQH